MKVTNEDEAHTKQIIKKEYNITINRYKQQNGILSSLKLINYCLKKLQ